MHEKNFTVAFFRFAASIITHIRVQVNIRHYLEKKGGKLTLVDLQPQKKPKQTPVQIFSTRCFNEKCAELLTWSLE